MQMPSRRSFLSGAGAAAAFAQPLRQVAAAAKPVRITNIDIFPIEISIPQEELLMGKYARYTFYEVQTDVRFYGSLTNDHVGSGSYSVIAAAICAVLGPRFF